MNWKREEEEYVQRQKTGVMLRHKDNIIQKIESNMLRHDEHHSKTREQHAVAWITHAATCQDDK